MDATPPEKQDPREKRGGSVLLLCLLGVFAIAYFLFPVFLVYPLSFIYKTPTEPLSKALEIFFYPQVRLANVSPEYAKLMMWELHVVGWDIYVE